MAIRWKENELDDLRKEIARYNRKIKKLEKMDLGMGSAPERASMRSVKKMNTRAELNQLKRSIARVMKPGSEELVTTKGGITIPKYERAEINALNARINARRRKDYQRAAEARAKGDLPLMGRIRANEAKPRRSLAAVKPADYKEYKRVALNEGDVGYTERRQKAYKQSYFKMIDNVFSPRDARKIKARLNRIPLKKMVEATIDNEEVSISIGSPPAAGRDNTAALIARGFKNVFPDEFKTLKLDDVEEYAEDIYNEEPDEDTGDDWFDYL